MKVTAKSLENFQVEIKTGQHKLIANETPNVGEGAGPDPYALLLSSLGACKIMTVQRCMPREKVGL